MSRKICRGVILSVTLLLATFGLALAWPNEPPELVLISGPGIQAQVDIKDKESLAIFRLGTLEDFNTSSPSPQSGIGFKITRFFFGGEFDFARLTYYPNPSGERG